MATADPRRSSRSRITQPQSQISSTTSSTSGRTERNARQKGGSPQKSTSASLSSEPPDDLEDPFTTRRRTRGQEDRGKQSSTIEKDEMANGDDDIQDEDEAVRCICGYDEYPGPPPIDNDVKQAPKEGAEIDSIYTSDVADEISGFFVQCDICKVWQHGACVGIMTEESSPDEYFCEECRRDLHKIFTASNGQKYSHYLPLKRPSREPSRATSLAKDETRSPKDAKETRSTRQTSVSQASKRRSTMNSREAAYDEAEALRRAIEESKEEAEHDPLDTRRPKRGRDESEDKHDGIKRQRTSSRSVSPSLDKAVEDSDSDDAPMTRNGSSKSKSRTSTTQRNLAAERAAQQEERNRQKADQANRRKGRAERRRADDSDPSEEMPLAAARSTANRSVHSNNSNGNSNSNGNGTGNGNGNGTTGNSSITAASTLLAEETAQPPLADAPASSQPVPDTPPPTSTSAPAKTEIHNNNNNNNSKKSSRSHKKKGRNQYTRDRDAEEDSPGRSQSRDPPSTSSHNKNASSDKSHSRSKGGLNSKVTMSDMKRRATALLDFISRTQIELAGETTPPNGKAGNEESPQQKEAAEKDAHPLPDQQKEQQQKEGQQEKAQQETELQKQKQPTTDGDADAGPPTKNGDGQGEGSAAVPPAVNAEQAVGTGKTPPQGNFTDMSCMEMMDSLTRRLVKWQQEYA